MRHMERQEDDDEGSLGSRGWASRFLLRLDRSPRSTHYTAYYKSTPDFCRDGIRRVPYSVLVWDVSFVMLARLLACLACLLASFLSPLVFHDTRKVAAAECCDWDGFEDIPGRACLSYAAK